MLEIYVLAEGHAFVLNQFLGGKRPQRTEIAAAQTLVSA
jgi:hypothetical protein